MSAKAKQERAKMLQEKCQSVLSEMLRDEDNKYCVDCDAKGPRWASWNLGLFLCIRCAGIHRNLGVHVSKVKSVNLDTWTPEQVASMQVMGNSKARAVYEANMPDSFRRPQSESSLEAFIRGKYEHKKYIAKEFVPPKISVPNWESEIEHERMNRKKKRAADVIGQIEPPAAIQSVPKSTIEDTAPTKLTPKSDTQSGLTQDLLGLDSPGSDNDFFGSFTASGPPPSQQPPATVTIAAASSSMSNPPTPTASNSAMANSQEEADFFNQTSAVEEKTKGLTKDSIMALYGKASNISPMQNNLYSPQPNVQSYASPQNNFAPNNLFMGQMPNNLQSMNNLTSPQPNNMANVVPNTQSSMLGNGAFNIAPNMYYGGAMNVGPNNLQMFNNTGLYGGASTGMYQAYNQPSTNTELMWDANSLYTKDNSMKQNQLQQQMASISLTPQSQNTGHTLSNNLWQ